MLPDSRLCSLVQNAMTRLQNPPSPEGAYRWTDDSPVEEAARLDAGASASEEPAVETLVGPGTPATVVRTHPITHHPLLSCGGGTNMTHPVL